MTSNKKIITYLWSFTFGFFQLITFDHLWTIHLILKSMPEIFYISILWVSLWLFGHHTFQYKSLFLFISQILVCATAFVAYYLSSRFDICWAIKQKHKEVERYIGTILCMYQNHQDHWLIIHDNLENQFTTVVRRCQDMSHKDRCAYITSWTRKCTTPLVRRY